MDDKEDMYHAHTQAHKREVVNMDTNTETIDITEYRSTAYPDIRSSNRADVEAIEFIDANPVVIEIVTGDKSKAFGVDSCVYIGWAQKNNSAGAILTKVKTLMRILSGGFYGEREGTIWNWRAHFTFDHYNDKGFKGGFFQAHDRFPRGCLSLDYTPETLPEVVKWFYGWSCNSDTQRITIDNKEIPAKLWKGV
jgi:hypothetical protein